MRKELINYLTSFVNEDRLQLFNKLIKERTNYLTVVLEDIFQPQNASAVLRSCDCFGIQNIHIIENRNKFTVDKEVVMGASKWLTIHKHNNSANNSLEAIKLLKASGYRIIATTPHINEQTLNNFDLSKGKAALIFGSELLGISKVAKEEADEFLKIPMFGFTESLNISVSAAVILHHLTLKMREQSNVNWHLCEEDHDEIMLQWLKRTIKQSKLLEQKFWKDYEQNI